MFFLTSMLLFLAQAGKVFGFIHTPEAFRDIVFEQQMAVLGDGDATTIL